MEAKLTELFLEYGLPLLCIFGLPAVSWLGFDLLFKKPITKQDRLPRTAHDSRGDNRGTIKGGPRST